MKPPGYLVASNCPICDQPIPATVAHCSVCGFPTSLAIEALRAIGPDGPAQEADGPVSAPVVGPPPRAPPSPEEELCASISRDLRGKIESVRELGRGAPDVTSEMCQAALVEAEGRVSEALEVLRRAQRSLDRQTDELFAQRLESLESRDSALRGTGVRFGMKDEILRLKEAVDARQRELAGTLLLDVEQRYTQFESDWRGLQGLLRQIDALRKDASELGVPLGEIESEISEIRDRLGDSVLTEDRLDGIAQSAAQTLMLLHEAIPNSLDEELRRDDTVLARYPEDHPPSAAARRLHAEATRHLKKGRLADAIQSVRELRRELARLETLRATTKEVAIPPRPVVVEESRETEAQALARLLEKARRLAGRVRTLPPDSEIARDAAVQIREVTDLLRKREVRRADEALARLIRMLAEGPEAR